MTPYGWVWPSLWIHAVQQLLWYARIDVTHQHLTGYTGSPVSASFSQHSGEMEAWRMFFCSSAPPTSHPPTNENSSSFWGNLTAHICLRESRPLPPAEVRGLVWTGILRFINSWQKEQCWLWPPSWLEVLTSGGSDCIYWLISSSG